MMDEMKDMNMLLTFALGREKKAKKYYEKCSECGKLLNKTSMKKHVLTHKPPSQWPWSCALCRKRMQTQHDLIKHLRSKVHENDRVPMEGTEKWYELINHDRNGGYEPFSKKQRSFSNDQPDIENDLKESILNALYSDIPKQNYVTDIATDISYDSKFEWDSQNSPQEKCFEEEDTSSYNCTDFSQPLDLSTSSMSLKSDSKSESLSLSKSLDENKNNILTTPASPTSSSSSTEQCRNLRVRVTKLEIDPIIIEFIKQNQMKPYKSEQDISFTSQQEISFDSQQEVGYCEEKEFPYNSEQENTYNSEQENTYNSEQENNYDYEQDIACNYEQEIPYNSMQENGNEEIPV
eukprot:GFUD01010302.1.p2 GENE.GFUD01010302.1~~GFUD01010302.1.p2  ORF type:complete len:349 (-),score=67.83 GFUD01010302.1:1759-2805(-)